MSARADRLLERVLSGRADADIPFDGLCRLLERLGFTMRVRGSHHIFGRRAFHGALNLQPVGTRAKAYQVRQVRQCLLDLGLDALPSEGES
jgi:hypothetical protein